MCLHGPGCFWFWYLPCKKVCISLAITQFLTHAPSRLFSLLKYIQIQPSSSQSEVLPKEADLVKWSYFCLAFYLIHTCPPSFPGHSLSYFKSTASLKFPIHFPLFLPNHATMTLLAYTNHSFPSLPC